VEPGPGAGLHGAGRARPVDGRAGDARPPAAPPLHEVVEAAQAPDVDGHAADRAALQDHHLGLRYRAASADLAAETAQEMQDLNAAVESVLARLDEIRGRALKPGRGHPPVIVPDSPKAVPVPRVTKDDPVLDDFPDQRLLVRGHPILASVLRSASVPSLRADHSSPPSSGQRRCPRSALMAHYPRAPEPGRHRSYARRVIADGISGRREA